MNRNRKLITMALAAGMAATTIISPALAVDDASITKQETVFVNADSTGDVRNITVSEWLKNSGIAGDVADNSELSGIVNVKGDETFTQEGNTLIWDSEGKDIYYQGTSDK